MGNVLIKAKNNFLSGLIAGGERPFKYKSAGRLFCYCYLNTILQKQLVCLLRG